MQRRKLSTDERLVIASHNQGKLVEIRQLVEPLGYAVAGAGELGLDEPEETGITFTENAVLKARLAAEAAQMPALADDSGLEVTALGGSPGIYSARWAGPDRDFSVAMQRVSEALLMVESLDRSCRFVCALALAWPDGHHESFVGTVEGHVVWPPRGDKGFGYDPMFQPVGHELSFAEMEPEAKHAMSHRAKAFSQLLNACLK